MSRWSSRIWVSGLAASALTLGSAHAAWAVGGPAAGSVSAQTLRLPDGPASVRGLADDASVDAFGAQVGYTVPIQLPVAAAGFGPTFNLSYSGVLGNGPLGVGWSMDGMAVRRSLREGVPHYDDTDALELVGVAGGGELVRAADGSWRVIGQGGSIKVERQGGGFVVSDANGTRYFMGTSAASRLEEDGRVASWMAERVVSLTGQAVRLSYLHDDGQVYLDELVWGPADVFRMQIAYGERPDPVLSYRTGFAVRTARRVEQIRVRSHGELLRSYLMDYSDQLPLSRLSRVRSTGRGGQLAWPALTFGYGGVSDAGVTEVDGVDGWVLGEHGATLLDVDGDGMGDLVRVEAGNHAFKKNLGASFAPEQPIVGAEAVDLDGAQLMDVDGDVKPDLVRVVDDEWRSFRLDGESWEWRGAWPGSAYVPLHGSGVTLADLDGDRRPDVLRAMDGGLEIFFNGRDGLGAPMVLPAISAEDAAVAPGRAATRFHDVNGDGLADAIWLHDSWLEVYLGRGDGTFVAQGRVDYPFEPVFDLGDLHLTDLNRDGLMDLVRVSAGDVAWYAGEADGGFATVGREVSRPETIDGDAVIQVMDVNGNGSDDVVWSSPRGMWLLDLAGSTTAGMLTSVDNGLGKRLEIDYAASATLAVADATRGQPWHYRLPISIPVPTAMAISPGAGQPTRLTRYQVRDGFWDADENRFGGFLETVKESVGSAAGDTARELSRYLAGVGPGRVLRGKPSYVAVSSGDGQLFSETFNTWVAEPVASLGDGDARLRRAVLTYTRTLRHDGVTTPVESASAYEVDGEGRLIVEKDLGRTDLTGDERMVRRSYASDDTSWVRDKVIEETHLDGTGTSVLAHRRLLYGDDAHLLPFGQIGKGWLREVDEQLVYGGENRWIATQETAFDALGQPISERAGGVTRRISYDPSGLHPVSETVESAPGHTLTWTTSWDMPLGVPVDATDPAGETTHLGYDALGRITSLGLAGRPAHIVYEYDWSAPLPRTYTYKFDGRATALTSFTGWAPGTGWRQSVSVVDGSSEPVYDATRLDASTWIVNSMRRRDERGRVVSVAEAFYAATIEGLTSAPAAVPAERVAYDALGRRTVETLASGGTRTNQYLAFGEIESATALAPVLRRLDGLDRPIHTERTVNGVVEQIDATYDAESRITALSLAGGRVQHRFEYDTLGRLRRGVDPDTGAKTYAYDDAGRLTAQTNAVGQTLTYDYDGAGRPLGAVDTQGAHYVYHYDQARLPTAAHTMGRLAWVEEPTGGVDFSYDELGRQSFMRRQVVGRSADKTVTYSPSGLILSLANDDGFTVETGYDGAGRPTSLGDLWRALRLDATGRVLEERFGNGVRQVYERDALGMASRVQILPAGAPALYDVTVGRNPLGQLNTVTDTDGVGLDHSATYGFDGAARLVLARQGPSAHAFAFAYGYDELTNMTARVASGVGDGGVLTGAYRYGESGAGPRQLTSVLGASGVATRFGYDGAGRETVDGDRALAYDGFDQLASVSRAGQAEVTHGYGFDGQRIYTRTADGHEQRFYTEDLIERPGTREHYVRIGSRTLARVDAVIGAAGAASHASPTGMGRKWWAGLSVLLGIALVVVARRHTGGRTWRPVTSAVTLAAFVSACAGGAGGVGGVGSRGASLSSRSVLYFHQGVSAAPVLFTRGDGTVVEERRFEPFGQPLEALRPGAAVAPVDFGLEPTNGLNKETDPTSGLSYHGARWLDPRTARWTEPDPPTRAPDLKFMQAPWQLNPYQYVDQNPVAFWDPDGREPQVSREEVSCRDIGYTPAVAPSSSTSPVAVTPTPPTVSSSTSTTAPAKPSAPKASATPASAGPHRVGPDYVTLSVNIPLAAGIGLSPQVTLDRNGHLYAGQGLSWSPAPGPGVSLVGGRMNASSATEKQISDFSSGASVSGAYTTGPLSVGGTVLTDGSTATELGVSTPGASGSVHYTSDLAVPKDENKAWTVAKLTFFTGSLPAALYLVGTNFQKVPGASW